MAVLLFEGRDRSSIFFDMKLTRLSTKVLIFSCRAYCYGKATGQQWCAFTSTNIGIYQQKAGKGLPIEEGKDLLITCK